MSELDGVLEGGAPEAVRAFDLGTPEDALRIEGGGGIRYVSKFLSVARSVPLIVMVEPACTAFVPAGSTPGLER